MTRPSVLLRTLLAAALLAPVASAAPGRPEAELLLERPQAEPFLGMPEKSKLGSDTDWDLEEAWPALAFDDPVFFLAEPGSDRYWVVEREGRIVSFAGDESTTELRVVLDLRDVTRGDGDSGMLSMAFHPDFAEAGSPSEGLVFVAYERHDDEESPLHFRLSRFHVDRATGIADPDSEAVLIDQLDQNVWHQGGAVFFHPGDGFLYVTVGDEGGGRCFFNNCQRIDRDLFSGVLRLDVDCRAGASHAPPRQPLTGTTAHYCIPDDNPFVGVANALEEFYAIGLRSPHRMTYDDVDDLTWIGEVGQSAREEIDVLAPGANYQWNVMEGKIPFGEDKPIPDPLIGTWTDPVFDYGRLEGGSVIGGYVYRGTALPSLEGRYVYGDFVSGRIWALRYHRSGSGVALVDNELLLRSPLRGRTNGITSFGLDRDGEILVLSLGEPAKLYRLVASHPGPGDMPVTLSATGLFEDLADLEPIDALVPYDVAVPLWSDGTRKRRWMSVPSDSVVAYSPDGAWDFPEGSVFVKHFDLPIDDEEPSSLRRLETRVLVRDADGGVYGVTYKWREDESDADLLTGPLLEDIEVRTSGGGTRTQRYTYPGPRDCESCHHPATGGVLGPRARQFASSSQTPDFLEEFAEAGFLDVDADALDRSKIPAFAALDDPAASAELRVRSYLDSNCSHCHGAQSIDRSAWDARITTPLNRQGIVGGPLLGEYGVEEARVVAPKDASRSVLWLRTETTSTGLRMPPLARAERDEEFLAALEEWIAELDAGALPEPMCGDAARPYDKLGAGDALAVLRTAVGLVDDCRACICDVDASGAVNVSDALKVLRKAVGFAQEMGCGACALP